jgi:hypothetical protein
MDETGQSLPNPLTKGIEHTFIWERMFLYIIPNMASESDLNDPGAVQREKAWEAAFLESNDRI